MRISRGYSRGILSLVGILTLKTVGSSCVQNWKAPSLIQMSVYKVCRVSWGIYVLWWIYVQAHCPKEYSQCKDRSTLFFDNVL